MRYLLYFLIYIYMATGFIIGLKGVIILDKYRYFIGTVIVAMFVGIYYAFMWLPELLATVANKIMSK